jgi:hypothetical protein
MKRQKAIKKLERGAVRQLKEPDTVGKFEQKTGEEIDIAVAPGLLLEERLKKRWKGEELEHEIKEEETFTNEPKDIEEEEEKGENPYPEIEEAIKEESDEEDEEEE